MTVDRDQDRKLAERVSAGDERAFDELVARHREPSLSPR